MMRRNVEGIVNGGEVSMQDGIVRIICGNRIRAIVVFRDPITLRECLHAIRYDKETDKDCIVIFDEALSGVIYRYNQYGDHSWYEYGRTYGYA